MDIDKNNMLKNFACWRHLKHCVWYDDGIALQDATVQHLLGMLKERIKRAIAVVNAACHNNMRYCRLDMEVHATRYEVRS